MQFIWMKEPKRRTTQHQPLDQMDEHFKYRTIAMGNCERVAQILCLQRERERVSESSARTSTQQISTNHMQRISQMKSQTLNSVCAAWKYIGLIKIIHYTISAMQSPDFYYIHTNNTFIKKETVRKKNAIGALHWLPFFVAFKRISILIRIKT